MKKAKRSGARSASDKPTKRKGKAGGKETVIPRAKTSRAKAPTATQKSGPASSMGAAQNETDEKAQSSRDGPPNDESKPSAAMASLEAGWSINQLIEYAAAGNEEAASYLHELAVDTTRALYKLCVANAEMVEAIKHKHPRTPWPLLHTELKANKEGYLTVPGDHLLRALGVIRKGHSLDEKAKGTNAALTLYRIMVSHRDGARKLTTKRERDIQALPPLSKSEISLSEWWKLAEPFIAEWWGAEFQNHPDFAGWHEVGAMNAKTPRGQRRSRIKGDIRRGLSSLAAALMRITPVDSP